MEDIDVETLCDSPRASRVRVVGDALVNNAGSSQSEGSIDDVGVTCDPPDIRHAPVHILRMYVLIILGGASDIGQITAGAMLASFGFPSRPTRVHEKEWGFGIHRDGLNLLAAKILHDIVHEIVTTLHHGRGRAILARIAPPDQDFLDFLTIPFGGVNRNIRRGLMVDQLSAAVVTVCVN